VAPGLTRAERTWIPIIIPCSVILFVIGVILSYKIVLPTVLNFFDMITPDNVEPGVSFALYLTFVMSFLMVFGVGLQFPFVVTLLILTGIVDANSLAKRRWYVIAIIIAVGVVVSYGMEVITMAMFFIPIYLLFELSLIVGRALRKWFIRRKRNNTVRG
ncbi:MAG: twin-arginine translocase subunit TatC, partial [Clostridiales bacterium]|nr:twin-arginine translocase subunit TatC [Clostridiales bacterium]